MKPGIAPLQYLLILGSEAIWNYCWAITAGLWVLRTGVVALDPLPLVAILVLAVATTRWAAGRRRYPKAARVALSLVAVITTLGAAFMRLPAFTMGGDLAQLPAQLFGGGNGLRAATSGAFAIFLWWRATGLGRSPMSLSLVEDEFAAGTLAMTTLLVIVALAGAVSPFPAEPLLLGTFIVVSTGLVGMPLARVVDVSRDQGSSDGAALKLGGPWLILLLGVVAALLTISLLLAQLFTFDLVDSVWQALAGPVGSVLGVAAYLLAIPFGLLAQLLIFLLSLFPRSGAARPPRQPNDLQWLDRVKQAESAGLSPEVVFALKVALAIALTVLLIWMVGRVMARLRPDWDRDDVEETHDFVWSWPGLSALWSWLLGRWRPLRSRALAGLVHRSEDSKGVQSVRALYREFLILGIGVGRGRRSSETPLEYERRLFGDPLLGGREEVRSLTEVYNRERYGPATVHTAPLLPLVSTLARLRSLWQAKTP